MKTNVARLLTGAFALALLLAVGLSANNSAQAQTAGPLVINIASEDALSAEGAEPLFLCSQNCTAEDGRFTITVTDADGTAIDAEVTIRNLDLAVVTDKITAAGGAVTTPADDDLDGSDANPKTIAVPSAGITVAAVHKSSGLQDNRDDRDGRTGGTDPDGDADTDNYSDNTDHAVEVKAFNGNRIQITYRATGTLGTTRTLTVDNVKPSLLVTSPAHPLVVKGNTDVTFSADVTDTGAGFPAKAADVFGENKGRIQLFVGRVAAPLVAADFTAIDNGWRLSKTLNSSDIASLGAAATGAKVPWHIVIEDQAGNVRESTGNITGKVVSATDAAVTVDATFSEGYGASDVFGATTGNQRTLQVSDGTTTFKGPITAFAPASNLITVALTGGSPPAAPTADQLTALEGKTFTILNTQLITVDGTSPAFIAASVRTGTAWRSSSKDLGIGIAAKNTSIVVGLKDVGGIVSDSVTPSAFSVTGNTVSSVLLVEVGTSNIPAAVVDEDLGGADHLVFLTLGTMLGSDERPTVGIQAGVIKDNAGNALGATTPAKAVDGLGPNLTLSKNTNISNKEVKVTITADEQLSSAPTVTLGRVHSTDATTVANSLSERVKMVDGEEQCNDGDANTDTAAVTTDQTIPRDAVDGETDCVDNHIAGDKVMEAVPGRAAVAAGTPAPSTTALSYTSTFKINAIPSEMVGGEFNVYVEGTDTQDTDNTGKVGHKTDAADSAAFTFELDQRLNRGQPPVVKVTDKTAASGDAEIPSVETIDPMIVTVDFSMERGEYPRDSFPTVELTSAVLKVTFADGTSETTTFDLDTQVSSQDNIQYTIPLLNPKIGTYTLTVKGEDEAGNVRTDGTGTTAESLSATWKVIEASPVKITLEPGWNLISLPFQPTNPAINSIIPADHPVGLVMTYDSVEGVWLFSRRDADSGMFTGDVAVLTATTGYFVNTDSFEPLELFRPATATAAAAPAQPPAIEVTTGWNLVPVVSSTKNSGAIDADTYFGTLGTDWLRALAWNPLARTWESISRDTAFKKLEAGTTGKDRCGDVTYEAASDATAAVDIPATVCIGEGLWLWVTKDGTLIPS